MKTAVRVEEKLKELGFTLEELKYVFRDEDFKSSSDVKAVYVSVDTTTLTVEWDCYIENDGYCYGWIADFHVTVGVREEDTFKKRFTTEEKMIDFVENLLKAWKEKDEEFLLQELEF